MLFGHQDDTNQSTPTAPADDTSTVNPLAVDPDTGVSLPVAPDEPATAFDAPDAPILDQPISDTADTTAPVIDAPAPEVISPVSVDPPADLPTESVEPTSPIRPSLVDNSASGNDLLSLKQQALAQLTPLVGQLDQNPEEKFRTTMMMIQSTDDQSLIQNAYDAAQAIADEKVRAQALLDVVNEINYFTQQKTA